MAAAVAAATAVAGGGGSVVVEHSRVVECHCSHKRLQLNKTTEPFTSSSHISLKYSPEVFQSPDNLTLEILHPSAEPCTST